VSIRDTSPKAEAVYYRRLAEMTPAERINIAVGLCKAGDSLQRAALRRAYPDADESEITYRIAVTRLGEELARKVYRNG
jgi:hypothetical protein